MLNSKTKHHETQTIDNRFVRRWFLFVSTGLCVVLQSERVLHWPMHEQDHGCDPGLQSTSSGELESQQQPVHTVSHEHVLCQLERVSMFHSSILSESSSPNTDFGIDSCLIVLQENCSLLEFQAMVMNMTMDALQLQRYNCSRFKYQSETCAQFNHSTTPAIQFKFMFIALVTVLIINLVTH